MADFTLRPSKAPNLLIAPPDYVAQYQDQLNNALRLYFNQIDNVTGTVLGPDGGKYIQNPHLSASNSDNQYATATDTPTPTPTATDTPTPTPTATDTPTPTPTPTATDTPTPTPTITPTPVATDTPTIVQWGTLESGSGFTLNLDNTATCLESGVFKIDYSLQLANTSNSIQNAYVWLKLNGTDLARSGSRFTLQARKSAGVFEYVVAYSSITFEVETGDSIGLWWSTDLAYNPVGPVDGVFMDYIPPQVLPYPHPSAPSAIGSITFVSRLPTTL